MPIKFDEHQPKTLEEAISLIYSNMDVNEIEYVKRSGTDGLHHSFGRDLRNGWNLWDKKSVLHQHFANRFGIGHADDMSGMILEGLEAVVFKQDIDFDAKAQYYRDFWLDQKIDPLTIQRL